MVSCDSGNMACQGGWLDRAWDYLSNTGIVTENCWAYTSGNGQVEACRSTCSNASAAWKKYKCAGTYTVSVGADAMKQDLYTNGPMEVAFQVF
jgi:cathepsin B